MTNSILTEQDRRYDLSGRLRQIFLDADELMSDLTNAISEVVTSSLDAPNPESVAAQAELIRLRCKVHNIVFDFKAHYDNDLG